MASRCPLCEREVVATRENLPFCSERCRLIDLGKWIDGDYRLSDGENEGGPSSGAGQAGPAAGEAGGRDDRSRGEEP